MMVEMMIMMMITITMVIKMMIMMMVIFRDHSPGYPLQSSDSCEHFLLSQPVNYRPYQSKLLFI